MRISGYIDGMTTSSASARAVPDISFLLTHASHVLATRMAAAFAESATTPRGFCVLSHAMQGEYTQIELAALSDLDKTTMVITLDELEAAGLAERQPSAKDRRARIVRVTEAGQEAVAQGTAIADRVHREVLDSLAPGQGTAFASVLEELTVGLLAEPIPSAAEGGTAVRRPRRTRRGPE